MKKEFRYSIIAGLIVFMSACSGKLQTYDLNETYSTSLHYQPAPEGAPEPEEADEADALVGVPAKNFYGGDLKRGGIWWANKGVTLEKGDEFIFEVDSIGPDSIPLGATNPSIDFPGKPFGATFPPIDLIVEPVMLKVSARAEGVNGMDPILQLEVNDASGYKADAKRPAAKILNSAEYQDYYFDLRDIYMQREPKHKVNGAMINSLRFFINPGQAAYAGKIFIREIRVVPAASVEKK